MAKKEENKTMAVAAPVRSMVDYILAPSIPEKNIQKLSLPPLLKINVIPVGSTVSGKLARVVSNFSGKENMRESKCLHLVHDSGAEFLFPVTGTVKQALKAIGDIADAEKFQKAVGQRTMFFKRLPDTTTDKYSGKGEPAKKMYQIEVAIERE